MSTWVPFETETDLVIVENLKIDANVGPDCWGRSRPQPLLVSVALEADLRLAGEQDDLTNSVNYGSLSKDLLRLVTLDQSKQFGGLEDLGEQVVQLALAKVTNPSFRVAVSIKAPKLLLQDAKIRFDITRDGSNAATRGKYTWVIEDWRIYVLIGMNPPERLKKQVLILNMQVFTSPTERVETNALPDFVDHLFKFIDTTEFLTLEKFSSEVIKHAMQLREDVASIVLTTSKPSAVGFADAASIRIKRYRA
ncbi:3005_t:CDS:2 [Acaulospora colombiana]|uniref:3005_t:CDS:1 n=1 Tax=Acaulospora colombiana TaxID=27376 RepID=A0ACA9NYV3_9GLOM|nr:3005_t:CDS:2 [Acaulospora colombiana]